MTQRHRKFQAGRQVSDYEPVSFDLGDKTFNCKPAVQGAVLLEFVAKADSDSGGSAAEAVYGFFADAMEPAEYERFREELNNPGVIYDMTEIGEIASWLVEEYAARPTQGQTPSPSGQSDAGPQSTERHFSAV